MFSSSEGSWRRGRPPACWTQPKADLLGRDRQWVYAHAGELGAFRYGDGPKARIGFDLAMVEQWKRERQIRDTSAARRRDRRRSSGLGVAATRLIHYDVSGSGT